MFFDGFKAIEAIGGVHPNGINMDKDERLAWAPDANTCVVKKPKKCVIMTCTILRDLRGYRNPGLSVKFKSLFSTIEFYRSQMTATIPNGSVGTRSKFSPFPTFNVDNQVIFPFLLGKT